MKKSIKKWKIWNNKNPLNLEVKRSKLPAQLYWSKVVSGETGKPVKTHLTTHSYVDSYSRKRIPGETWESTVLKRSFVTARTGTLNNNDNWTPLTTWTGRLVYVPWTRSSTQCKCGSWTIREFSVMTVPSRGSGSNAGTLKTGWSRRSPQL